MNNKGADQTARMCRLICAFVVRIWQNWFSHDKEKESMFGHGGGGWLGKRYLSALHGECLTLKDK